MILPATVAVTGCSGRLGRAVVDDLLEAGYGVVGLDRQRCPDRDGVSFHEWDGRSVDAIADPIEGCSALIHLAAIPSPIDHPPEVVFGNNTMATFAALQAAGLLGIPRAVIASSGSAYGTAFSPKPTHSRYVPVDEEHPLENAEAYGLSKEVDERTAAMAARRFKMSVAALRFHWIATREEQLRTIAAQTGPRDWAEELRGLWGYVDVRDAARACRLAVEAAHRRPYGFAPLNIVAADALSTAPIADLLAAHAPEIEIRAPLSEQSGAYAIERAREVIGWRPEHSWRD